jgi:truncated hemoglobin YjbI
MSIAIRDSSMMREASRLAAARGELGNSDAIRLLQIPHCKEDVEDVLRTFEKQLSRQAKSKLTLDAFVPLPPDVINQRFEAIFDKFIITGNTYTTASGTVVPNELQYYNGEMVHFYGECTNVQVVNGVLAGSGYKAITLTYAGGRQAAVAQLWSSRFTDTSIGPYSAMFIVVAVVRDDAPQAQTSIRADPNGASSALVMFDGSFDPATAVYENKARLFLVRLLDTTQVAIDVGRERMGTDKRPGTIEMAHNGRRLRLSIKDGGERGVVRGDLELADDPAAFMPEIAKAAATAGIPFRALPRGTEYAYPAVARIGQGPVVSWQWRSDLVPRLQPVVPGAVVFDPSSEEGRMLLTWGFTPKVLGYIPNVRGMVTGLADRMPAHARLFRAAFPGEPGGVVGQLPVLRLIAQEFSPRPAAPVNPSAYGGRPSAEVAVSGAPRWAWDTTFLGSLTAMLRKEVVGVTPDGLRINWHVTKGSFVGPGLDAIVLPGAADWMRIRRDGVANVSVQACFETREGVRVYGSYGGIFDLGPDGFARAVRDEYDPLPPVVVTPTYATADARLEWLNRAQCIGVGRVDMTALRVEFDVYVVRVGQRAHHASNNQDKTARPSARLQASLYDRVGGPDAIAAITDDFVAGVLGDRHLARFFTGTVDSSLRQRVIDLLCQITGGPCVYTGRDMKTAHRGMGITEADWKIAVDLFTMSLNKHHIAPREQSEFLQIIQNMKSAIVETPGRFNGR